MRPAQHPQHQLESTHARGSIRSLIGRHRYALAAVNLDGPIIEISGYIGTYQGQTCVLELTFRTPSSSYGPYGDRTKGQNLVRFQYVGDAGSRVALFGSTVTIQSNQFGTTQVIGHLYVEFAPRRTAPGRH